MQRLTMEKVLDTWQKKAKIVLYLGATKADMDMGKKGSPTYRFKPTGEMILLKKNGQEETISILDWRDFKKTNVKEAYVKGVDGNQEIELQICNVKIGKEVANSCISDDWSLWHKK